ncbi:MAG TPA: MarR family winged helix-turn-helix transcriptional regulator [Steroidobacteraceae bacterium]
MKPKLTYAFGRLNRVLRKRLSDVLRPFGLSVAQYTTLSVLQARSNLSNAELAKRAFITPQAMNEVMQGLEALKLVARRPSESHGRIVQLLLTPRGLDLLTECDEAVSELEQTMLGNLTGEQRTRLGEGVALCIKALEFGTPARSPSVSELAD